MGTEENHDKVRIVGLWFDVQTCDLLSMKQIYCPLDCSVQEQFMISRDPDKDKNPSKWHASPCQNNVVWTDVIHFALLYHCL